jgi:hypothetical protein
MGCTPISRWQFARTTALSRDTRDASGSEFAQNFPSDGCVDKCAQDGKGLGRRGSNSSLIGDAYKDGEQVAGPPFGRDVAAQRFYSSARSLGRSTRNAPGI